MYSSVSTVFFQRTKLTIHYQIFTVNMVKRKSEIISHFLTPAITFWLKSQLEKVEDLDINISAGDSKILRGKIDQVSLSTTKAIYQGIHVNQARVTTEKIAVNLGGVLRGKPLKLLQPIFVDGEIKLDKNALQTSLQSPLLKQGLIDLVYLLLEQKAIGKATPSVSAQYQYSSSDNHQEILAQYEFDWQNITVDSEKFILKATLINEQAETFPLTLTSNLSLASSNILSLNPIQIEGIPEIPMIVLNDFTVDLGTDVEIKILELSGTELFCQGKVKVVS